MMKHFIGKTEKWTNKGTDKQYVAVYLLHDTTYHYQPFTKFDNPKSSSC